MQLEVLIFPKFVRTYGTHMHHDKSLFHTCIVPPLISLLLGYVSLIHYDCLMRVAPCCWYRWQHQLEVRISC